MGTVFLARDHKHDRQVALKVLHPGLASMLGTERFSQEIRISAKLDHPHILTLIDSGESDGLVWYVLPYVRGESLRGRLAREKRLSLGDAVRIATQVASALEYAHRRGVIHRDIKPENILLHEGEAVVADFGIALAVSEAGGQRLHNAGVRFGTPLYMSPEQARGGGELDTRTDVYSLGVVVYEMLSGDRPHEAETAEALVSKLMHEQPARLRVSSDAIPESVDAAVMKALAKAPTDRFDTAADFAQALSIALDALPSGRAGRRTLFLTAVATGVLGLVAAAQLWKIPSGHAGSEFVVHDRAQLTFTGNASSPAISADGRQLAYVVRRCAGASCRFGIEIQDVGGGSSRRLLDGATALYGLGWSPDGRNLEFHGTIATRFGAYVISTLGGSPRLAVSAPGAGVSFLPGGDSVLVTMPLGTDGMGWLRVTTLDGAVHDSIPIDRPGGGLLTARMLAGGRWIVVAAKMPGRTEWRIVDRHGHQRDVFWPSAGATSWLGSRVTGNALWVLLNQSHRDPSELSFACGSTLAPGGSLVVRTPCSSRRRRCST
jgi:serine/threonine-protein kinase